MDVPTQIGLFSSAAAAVDTLHLGEAETTPPSLSNDEDS
jgi:hypothetical protein